MTRPLRMGEVAALLGATMRQIAVRLVRWLPIALQRLTGTTPPVATIHLAADETDRPVRALRERLAQPSPAPIAPR